MIQAEKAQDASAQKLNVKEIEPDGRILLTLNGGHTEGFLNELGLLPESVPMDYFLNSELAHIKIRWIVTNEEDRAVVQQDLRELADKKMPEIDDKSIKRIANPVEQDQKKRLNITRREIIRWAQLIQGYNALHGDQSWRIEGNKTGFNLIFQLSAEEKQKRATAIFSDYAPYFTVQIEESNDELGEKRGAGTISFTVEQVQAIFVAIPSSGDHAGELQPLQKQLLFAAFQEMSQSFTNIEAKQFPFFRELERFNLPGAQATGGPSADRVIERAKDFKRSLTAAERVSMRIEEVLQLFETAIKHLPLEVQTRSAEQFMQIAREQRQDASQQIIDKINSYPQKLQAVLDQNQAIDSPLESIRADLEEFLQFLENASESFTGPVKRISALAQLLPPQPEEPDSSSSNVDRMIRT